MLARLLSAGGGARQKPRRNANKPGKSLQGVFLQQFPGAGRPNSAKFENLVAGNYGATLSPGRAQDLGHPSANRGAAAHAARAPDPIPQWHHDACEDDSARRHRNFGSQASGRTTCNGEEGAHE